MRKTHQHTGDTFHQISGQPHVVIKCGGHTLWETRQNPASPPHAKGQRLELGLHWIALLGSPKQLWHKAGPEALEASQRFRWMFLAFSSAQFYIFLKISHKCLQVFYKWKMLAEKSGERQTVVAAAAAAGGTALWLTALASNQVNGFTRTILLYLMLKCLWKGLGRDVERV